MNLDQIDSVLRLADREVWVITAAAGDKRGGLAATFVAQMSIDRQRPVLLIGLALNHFTAELVAASGAFAAHLLRQDQSPLAWDFARDSGRQRDKLAGLSVQSTSSGPPILTDCLAWCDCRVTSRYAAGDRLFFWADVVAAGQPSAGPALREQALIGTLTAEQRQQLAAARQADIAVANLRPPPSS